MIFQKSYPPITCWSSGVDCLCISFFSGGGGRGHNGTRGEGESRNGRTEVRRGEEGVSKLGGGARGRSQDE